MLTRMHTNIIALKQYEEILKELVRLVTLKANITGWKNGESNYSYFYSYKQQYLLLFCSSVLTTSKICFCSFKQ